MIVLAAHPLETTLSAIERRICDLENRKYRAISASGKRRKLIHEFLSDMMEQGKQNHPAYQVLCKEKVNIYDRATAVKTELEKQIAAADAQYMTVLYSVKNIYLEEIK